MSDTISFTSMDDYLLYKRFMEEKNRLEVEETINDSHNTRDLYERGNNDDAARS